MANYTKSTDFEAKDELASGNPEKIIEGVDFEVEFDNIATAIASKSNTNNTTLTGTTTVATLVVSGSLTAGTIDGGTY